MDRPALGNEPRGRDEGVHRERRRHLEGLRREAREGARRSGDDARSRAEREQAKQAFGRSFIEFKDTPTGYDATGIKGEYTYRNRESLMWITRQGKKRYFFFINDRLWKMYDEVPLTESGVLGKTYLDAVNTMNAQARRAGPRPGRRPGEGHQRNDRRLEGRLEPPSRRRSLRRAHRRRRHRGQRDAREPRLAPAEQGRGPDGDRPDDRGGDEGRPLRPERRQARGKLERAHEEGRTAEEVAEPFDAAAVRSPRQSWLGELSRPCGRLRGRSTRS